MTNRRSTMMARVPTDAAREPERATLHELFERQAAAIPDAVALSGEGSEEVTYAQLDRRADVLAGRLQAAGAAPGGHVVLLIRSGSRHVISILAALKCGAAFTTLDADEPLARQQGFVEALQPSVLLFEPELSDAAASLVGRHPRLPVADDIIGDATYLRRRAVHVSPADTAFVAFTSGSTGRPKGIVQSHRSFAQFLSWFGTEFSFGPGARLAQWAAPTYDAAYCEILGPLVCGAAVCPVPRHVRNDPLTFLRWARLSRITVLELVPSYAAHLLAQLEEGAAEIWPELRYVLLAGEELTVRLARGLARLLPPKVDIYNLYGPSECVLATYHHVTRDDLTARSIPIGRAIDGREIVVCDDNGAECRPGVAGTIWVQSEFLADGYLNDEAKTAKVFVDLEESAPGRPTRALNTGDLGRWRPSGELEWLGRRDHLVKRRGVRIEIEEVERRLLDLPEVAECAVAAVHGAASQSEVVLIGHVVLAQAPEAAARPDPSEQIRHRATEVLPTQLIPDVFEVVPGLPKLPNGKLDRSALASVASRQVDAGGGESRPLTVLESEVARAYAAVLSIDAISATDDFFNLGGHSLLAMTVLDRIRVSTEVDLPILAIFEHPTVEGLAAAIEARRAGEEAAPSAADAAEAREFPLTPGQQALWLADRLRPGNPAYNVPLITVIRGSLDVDALERSLGSFVARHDILRARYEFDGSRPMQAIMGAGSLSLTLVRGPLAKTLEETLRDFVDAPFDLDRGPLFRFLLIVRGPEEHVLAAVFHHIVCDEPSLHVVADEIAALYDARVGGREAPRPPVQFAAFVADVPVRQPAQPGPSERVELGAPSLRMRRAASGVPASRVRGVLNPRETAAVRALASRTRATLFSTLLACFGAALLSEERQRQPVVVEVPVTRKRREDLSRCIGCFIDTAHVVFDWTRNPSFRDLLNEVNRQWAASDASRSDSRTTGDADALFTVHAALTPYVQLEGLECAPYELDRNTAKCDLGFYWRDEDVILSYVVEYATDEFNRDRIDRLVGRYEELIESACTEAYAPLATARRSE